MKYYFISRTLFY